MKEMTKGFEKIVQEPALLEQLNAGGSVELAAAPGGLRVYWDTVCLHKGWKLQKNYYFGQYRILDQYRMERACGTEAEMKTVLEKIGTLN